MKEHGWGERSRARLVLLLLLGGKRQALLFLTIRSTYHLTRPCLYPPPHAALSVLTASCSPSHWHGHGSSGSSSQLLPAWVLMPPALDGDKAGGHQQRQREGQRRGAGPHEALALIHQNSAMYPSYSLFFFSSKSSQTFPCLLGKIKAMEAEKTIIHRRIEPALRRTRQSVLHHLRYMPLL